MSTGKIITVNKKARFDYDIQETYEAGIVLQGSEVKSLREGRVNLKDSYAALDNGEIYLYNCHISPYNYATGDLAHEPLRRRKLLLHKREIRKLIGKIVEKGLTLIPLKVYFGSSGKVKVELALARGKRVYDKREDMKRRDAEREIERAFRGRNR